MGTSTISIVVATLALTGVFAACSSDPPTKGRADANEVTPEAGAVPACGSQEPATCPSTKPSYKADVVPVLNADCNTCHVGGNGKPWALTDYQDLLDWKPELLADLKQCTMPPEDAGHGISDADRATLIAWLACGAPNN